MPLGLCIILMLLQGEPPGLQKKLTAVFTFSSEQVGDAYGETLAVLGDTDGDGYSDFAVGAPLRSSSSAPLSGAVYVYGGTHGRPIGLYHGEGPYHRFGKALSAAELDGDRCTDLLVGAPYYRQEALGACGRVYLYSGAKRTLLRTFSGQHDGDRFGYAIGCMDMNSDGLEDVAVGAPGFDGSGGENCGAVFVYSGAGGDLLCTLEGEGPEDWFGYALCCLDMNGDGYGDLVVGAPGLDDGARRDAGGLFAHAGPKGGLLYRIRLGDPGRRLGLRLGSLNDLTGDGIQEFYGADRTGRACRALVFDGAGGRPLFTLEASEPAVPALPPALISLPDLNGDGLSDLALGPDGAGEGAVAVHSGADGRFLDRFSLGGKHRLPGYALCGPLDQDLKDYAWLVISSNPFTNGGDDLQGCVGVYRLAPPGLRFCLHGEIEGSGFGTVLAVTGDGNGDGKPDLAVGCPADRDAAGGIFRYPHIGGTPYDRLAGDEPGSLLGSAVAGISDVDGDGTDDLIVAAPRASFDEFEEAGRAWVRPSGSPDKPFKFFTGIRAGDRLGEALLVPGDVNGDGFLDILLGIPGFDEGNVTDAGRVILLSGKDFKILMTYNGFHEGHNLGMGLGPAGDLDGDGVAEFLCRGRLAMAAGNLGLVHVFSVCGNRPLFTLETEKGRSRFGAALLGIHDLDGDGTTDLLVSAPSEEGPAGEEQGRVYLYSGADGGLLGFRDGDGAGHRFGGSACRVPDLDGDGLPEIAISAEGCGEGRVDLYGSRDLTLLGRIEGEQRCRGFGASLAGPEVYDPQADLILYVGTRSCRDRDGAERGAVFAFGKDLPSPKERSRLASVPSRPATEK